MWGVGFNEVNEQLMRVGTGVKVRARYVCIVLDHSIRQPLYLGNILR